jgi:recombinational DNA repair protein RecR
MNRSVISKQAPAEASASRIGTKTTIPAASDRQRRVCNICGKPSGTNICSMCADKIRAEAVARKKREDKGEE